MEKGFSIYKCKLVKDGHIDYEGVINRPEDVFTAAKKMGLLDFSEEVFGMFTTDVKGTITSYHQISHGDLSSSIVHPREILKKHCLLMLQPLSLFTIIRQGMLLQAKKI